MSKQGIYQIKNLVNGKRYIGSSSDIERRFGKHKSLLKKGKHSNPVLQNAWDKYGKTSFQFRVIMECRESQLLFIEQCYLDKLNWNNLYNIAKDAEAPNKGREFTEEHKNKLSKAKSGENHPFYGKNHSKETKQKMSESKSGKNNPFYGKNHSKETKQKMSENSGKLNPQAATVIKYYLENSNKTQKEIANAYNIDRTHVSKIKNGKHWSFVQIWT